MDRPPARAARRTTSRLVVVPAALLGLGGSFAAGAALTGPGPVSAGSPGSSGSSLRSVVPAAESGSPVAAERSCDELLDHYVDAALPQVGPRGWSRPPRPGVLLDALPVEQRAAGDEAGAARSGVTTPGTPGTTRSTASATGTTVQEEGVDEPDSVKTDGTILARTDDGDLVLADVSGDRVEETARVSLLDLEDLGGAAPAPGLELGPVAAGRAELLLAGTTLLVVADSTTSTHVVSLDVADPTDPVVAEHVVYDTGLVSARLHGDVARLVLATGLPTLDFRVPSGYLGRESAREANEDLVREAPLEAWLPGRSVDGSAAEGFLDCADVAVPDDGLEPGTTTVLATTVDDLTGGDEAQAVAARLPLAYESPDHLYLATAGRQETPWLDALCLDACGSMLDGGLDGLDGGLDPVVPPLPDGTTYVVGFALDSTSTTPAGSAEVDGVLADRWSLDEHHGVLRLALEAGTGTADATSVVTLGTRAGDLVEIGRLDGLGRGEDLTSVRWFDDLAVLVTFRQVDPLHTVDLSDPARPAALGELEVPGFSSYLHPLGSQRLVGVGEGPQGPRGLGWGAQAGLFDVTDLTDVRRLDVVGYGAGSRAGAATDPRQLTWLPRVRTVLTVVVRGWRAPTAWVSTLALGGGRMDGTMTRVDRGSDADRVRLVPLPDDRVVLVTGDGARFFGA